MMNNSALQPFSEIRQIFRRISNIAITLLGIAYLTVFGLTLAERGREHLPANPLDAGWQSLVGIFNYFLRHPETYFWQREDWPAFELVSLTLSRSAGLLLVALLIALVIGVALGGAAALSKRKFSSTLVMLVAVLGISTPSFFLGMFFWVVNIQMHRWFDIQVLPSAGFGWDWHMVMPTLVLAMRPLAQIAQVTYVSLVEVFKQDYIRTANAKGLPKYLVQNRHAMRNILIPTLTTLGASLRFSLASLPVVELFFDWPGVGQMLLEAIRLGNDALVVDLILSLGIFFLIVNLVIEVTFPLMDARLRKEAEAEDRAEKETFLRWALRVVSGVINWFRESLPISRRPQEKLPALPQVENVDGKIGEDPASMRRRWVLRSLSSNFPLLLGGLLLIAILMLVVFGGGMTSASPYEIHGVMMIDGEIGAPPYEPSDTFPWGTDHIGRDMQALVLNGAKRTMALAFFGMLARLLLGTVLGALAGWQRGGWLDRFVSGAVGVWAAFPVTIFAMIMIQALGIQQGLWVFIVAISIVGWGEVAQFVRSQVVSIKPQPFIESAHSVGARSNQIMLRHVFPNLVNSLIVLAVLEMGGILMLLAELGYLNIFLGGGYRLVIGEGGQMQPVIAAYSDVPEWAALIANIRTYWRSYPWMAWSPGLAFFLSIMAFNLLGDGLRRFFEDTQANLSRMFNRYTAVAAGLAITGFIWFVQTATPLGIYKPESMTFDETRVMQDIEALSSPEFQGRETGTSGAELAAQFIAQRMEELDLHRIDDEEGYIQSMPSPRAHLVEMPLLQVLDESEKVVTDLVYRQDYAEILGQAYLGEGGGQVVGLALGEYKELPGDDPYGIGKLELWNNAVIIRKADLGKFPSGVVNGILVVAESPQDLERKDLFPADQRFWTEGRGKPVMMISQELGEELLRSAGSSLDDLERIEAGLGEGEVGLTERGVGVHMNVTPTGTEDILSELYYNVIGYIPGTGASLGLDAQVIIVSAYYDGLGVGPDGTLYPGANDNASGVAMMLELARLFKETPYQSDKTILFVAWAGGERSEGLSVTNVMNARLGFNQLTVEAVVELSGVGAGSGDALALGDDSTYRLVNLFQEAAKRLDVPTTTRGRDPHYGRYVRPGFGDRNAMTVALSWDGSDEFAHTPHDTIERIDPAKLSDTGRVTYLALLVMARETEY
jgi:peptide/nickel transport system permease protein